MRFALHRSFRLAQPAYELQGALVRGVEERGYYATTGIGPDLMEASREAVRGMIAYLGRTRNLAPLEAYALCSVAGDLKISEIVDAPNWVVSFVLPKNLFAESERLSLASGLLGSRAATIGRSSCRVATSTRGSRTVQESRWRTRRASGGTSHG